MSRSFNQIVVAAAIGALAVTTPPAFAQQAPQKQPEASTQEPAARGTMARDQRVCLKQTPTGSRVPRRECKTYGEWIDAGVDPQKLQD